MSKKNKKNPLTAITNYFKEVKAELKKVVWPTLKQIKNNTIIVIICLILVGAIIWVFDLGFGVTLGNLVDMAGQSQSENTQDESTIPITEGDMTEQPEDYVEPPSDAVEAEPPSDTDETERPNEQ